MLFSIKVFGQTKIANEEMIAINESVIALCRGGTLEGKSSDISITGNGEIKTVLLKKVANIGLGGEFKFSEEEWEGIKPLLNDPESYVQCVTSLAPLFVGKYEKKK